MDKRLDFRFQVPQPPGGPLVELSAAEAEKMLLKRLDEAGADKKAALWELAQFYKLQKRHDQALERLRQLIQLLPGPEDKANCIFTMGQAEENAGDYTAAVRYYKEALALEPASTFVWYFIHNTLGFSLNTLGRFAEGEDYCRKSIQIDTHAAMVTKTSALLWLDKANIATRPRRLLQQRRLMPPIQGRFTCLKAF